MNHKKFWIVYRYVILIFPVFLSIGFQAYVGIDMSLLEFIPLFSGFLIWSLVPYAVVVGLSFRFRHIPAFLTAAILMLSAEVLANLSVHVFPKSSTAGLLFIFMPIYQLVIVAPIGFGVGYLFGKLFRARESSAA